jgi:hypothetical protein
MSTETTLSFTSSTGVLKICILIKDVIATLTLNQHLFPKHQDVIRELLSLDRALLQVELSSGADFLLTLKDKAAPTIEQSRQYLIAFLEKVGLDPASIGVGSPCFLASVDSESRLEENNIEDFRSTINEFCTNLNALLALESKCVLVSRISYFVLMKLYARPCLLNASASSTEKPAPDDFWGSLPSTSSLDWDDRDEPEYVQLAQIHADDFAIGGVHYPETVTYDHNPHQNVSEDAFLPKSSALEDTWGSLPSTPLLDVEEDDVPTLTTNNRYRKSRKIRRRRALPRTVVRRGLKHSARDHPLYTEVTTGPDGLYHCPWEGKDPLCSHKPHKNKCIYRFDALFLLPRPKVIANKRLSVNSSTLI